MSKNLQDQKSKKNNPNQQLEIQILDLEINKLYENYKEELKKISNNTKIESFKKKFEKIKNKDKIISRIKSINKKSSILSYEELSNEKNTIDYFNDCIEVI
jgi:hypothetical protein